MAPFEPELERNRREYEDVGMKKIQATVWLFFGLIVSGVLTPQRLYPILVGVWTGVSILVFGYLEARKAAIYRRDLRERRESHPPHEINRQEQRP